MQGRLDLPDVYRDEDVAPPRCARCEGYGDAIPQLPHVLGCPNDEDPKPCTCTIACIPQGITENQFCRLSE